MKRLVAERLQVLNDEWDAPRPGDQASITALAAARDFANRLRVLVEELETSYNEKAARVSSSTIYKPETLVEARRQAVLLE